MYDSKDIWFELIICSCGDLTEPLRYHILTYTIKFPWRKDSDKATKPCC